MKLMSCDKKEIKVLIDAKYFETNVAKAASKHKYSDATLFVLFAKSSQK